MGARLARYTDNSSYADWAESTWDWLEGVGYLDAKTYAIYDGGHVQHNCTDINKAEFSYNNAVWTLGAAYMYNYVSLPIRRNGPLGLACVSSILTSTLDQRCREVEDQS